MKINSISQFAYSNDYRYFQKLEDDPKPLSFDYVCRCGCHLLKPTEPKTNPDVVSFSQDFLERSDLLTSIARGKSGTSAETD